MSFGETRVEEAADDEVWMKELLFGEQTCSMGVGE